MVTDSAASPPPPPPPPSSSPPQAATPRPRAATRQPAAANLRTLKGTLLRVDRTCAAVYAGDSRSAIEGLTGGPAPCEGSAVIPRAVARQEGRERARHPRH